MKKHFVLVLFCLAVSVQAQFKNSASLRLSDLSGNSDMQTETVVRETGYLSDRYDEIKGDINSGLATGEKIWLNFGTAETWKGIGISAAVIGTASLLDHKVRDLAKRNQSDFGDKVSKIDDYFGNMNTGYAVGAVYLTGLLSGNKEIRTAGAELITASAYTGIFTGIIKFAVGRARPKTGESRYNFYPGSSSFDHTSFLSGHTSWAFTVSTVMAEQMDNPYWKTAWYIAAGTVGYARMYHNVHWFSDVVAGAVLGYSIGKLTHQVMKGREDKVVVAPIPRPYSFSFSIKL